MRRFVYLIMKKPNKRLSVSFIPSVHNIFHFLQPSKYLFSYLIRLSIGKEYKAVFVHCYRLVRRKKPYEPTTFHHYYFFEILNKTQINNSSYFLLSIFQGSISICQRRGCQTRCRHQKPNQALPVH